MFIFDKLQNVFIWSIYIFPKIMKLFMEAPHTLRKLPIILFGIFGMVWHGFNNRVCLTQSRSFNLCNCLARICLCQINKKMHSWNFLDKYVKLLCKFCSPLTSSPLSSQLWPFYYFMWGNYNDGWHDANEIKKWKIYSYF